jgi:hypothetical protein
MSWHKFAIQQQNTRTPNFTASRFGSDANKNVLAAFDTNWLYDPQGERSHPRPYW